MRKKTCWPQVRRNSVSITKFIPFLAAHSFAEDNHIKCSEIIPRLIVHAKTFALEGEPKVFVPLAIAFLIESGLEPKNQVNHIKNLDFKKRRTKPQFVVFTPPLFYDLSLIHI